MRGRLGWLRRGRCGRGLIPAGAGQTGGVADIPRVGRAHPRRCGADLLGLLCRFGRAGSSPQVRGRLRDLAQFVPLPGLIPAGAGQTDPTGRRRSQAGAHPRRCGADIPDIAPEQSPQGSSPQVRGRLLASIKDRVVNRLIPAGAGQTSIFAPTCHSCTAHPRRCGADFACFFVGEVAGGSSPQVRGRPAGEWGSRFGGGLIPAGAGQTPVRVRGLSPPTAHPRRCGADRDREVVIQFSLGSSPQVRGRRAGGRERAAGPGLIPAGAGQTVAAVRAVPAAGAHPRRCGADPGALRAVAVWVGLIPAGAGQTGSGRFPRCPRAAHPRRCGADSKASSARSSPTGSSPQVRGRLSRPAR